MPEALLPSGHADTFARDHLPPPESWPEFVLDLPELHYPERLNAAEALLDGVIGAGAGRRPALHGAHGSWSYVELAARVDAIARLLVRDAGLVPGNRVLLRGYNSPALAACWLAVVKAGGVAVTTMPLLRAGELAVICEKAAVSHALCDARLAAELDDARRQAPTLREVQLYEASDADWPGVDRAPFPSADTARDDVAIVAFTSGTTGAPKGTMHFHRDLLAICDCAPRRLLGLAERDVCTGSSPLAFTFGLGGLLLFPLRHGAASALVERAGPEALLGAVARHRATVLFTTPTAYRMMLPLAAGRDLGSLRMCVSSGEHLPPAVSDAWRAATGIRMTEVFGSTEMLHCFIGAAGGDVRPGSAGRAIPGYRAAVLDERLRPLGPGPIGRLAVKGPTGCRYLGDPRQHEQVRGGWNLTGDFCTVDEDGYFWFRGRSDDIIVSSGYNIGAPEVEDALSAHPAVRECAVVGRADELRGQIVLAFVALEEGAEPSDALTGEMQRFVKERIAPYKYPRAIRYLEEFPRTETGKVHRARLREMAAR